MDIGRTAGAYPPRDQTPPPAKVHFSKKLNGRAQGAPFGIASGRTAGACPPGDQTPPPAPPQSARTSSVSVGAPQQRLECKSSGTRHGQRRNRGQTVAEQWTAGAPQEHAQQVFESERSGTLFVSGQCTHRRSMSASRSNASTCAAAIGAHEFSVSGRTAAKT